MTFSPYALWLGYEEMHGFGFGPLAFLPSTPHHSLLSPVVHRHSGLSGLPLLAGPFMQSRCRRNFLVPSNASTLQS